MRQNFTARRVSVPAARLWAVVHSSTLDGDIVHIDQQSLADLLLAIREAGYRPPEITVHDDGCIECDGRPLDVSGKPAAVIRIIYRHGAPTRCTVSSELSGDQYMTDAAVNMAVSRARRVLEQHGWTIASLPGDKIIFEKLTTE